MNTVKIRPDWLATWLSSITGKAHFSVMDMPFSQSKEWIFRDGVLEHVTGKFFRVVGVRCKNQQKETPYHPLLEQREVGTLGFLIRERNGKKEILVQAKIEPGNIGVVQLSPTCQATASNQLRVHGGKNPPFAEVFSRNDTTIFRNSLQSEQGTRFLGKFNRNVCATLGDGDDIVPDETHRWIPVDDFLSLLHYDFLVNTDARSVLVCGPWEVFAGRAPFTRYQTPFAQDLFSSAMYDFDHDALESVLNEIRMKRSHVQQPLVVPLDAMDGWDVTDTGIRRQDRGGFSVRQIAVKTQYREVSHWDQPIVDSISEGEIILMCGRKNGILHFLLRLQIEPGLENLIEFGPSETRVSGSRTTADGVVGTVIAECRQSEEGGRFFQDINHYRIIDIGDAREALEGEYWLTLAEIQELLKRGGWITNEGRSALSLLLPWL